MPPENSTRRLIQLCFGYWFFYVITGIVVKYFTGKSNLHLPGMSQIQFLIYNLLGSTLILLLIIVILRWYHLHSNKLITCAGCTFPQEFLYIIPSGVFTALIIPMTTLMYTLPISIMAAMVTMQASIMIISRIIDSVQFLQKISHKKVYLEENLAVIFALIAVGINLVDVKVGGFEFIKNPAAIIILCIYITGYSGRLYIMNYYRNTRAPGVKQDNKGFFAIEEITAAIVLGIVAIILFNSPKWFGWTASQILQFKDAISSPHPMWAWAAFASIAFGIIAPFSVFLFMFKGRTATFTGVVNRLTALLAGITATLICWIFFDMRFPKSLEWTSLVFVIIAIIFIGLAEKKRVAELKLDSK